MYIYKFLVIRIYIQLSPRNPYQIRLSDSWAAFSVASFGRVASLGLFHFSRPAPITKPVLQDVTRQPLAARSGVDALHGSCQKTTPESSWKNTQALRLNG